MVNFLHFRCPKITQFLVVALSERAQQLFRLENIQQQHLLIESNHERLS